MRSEPSFPVSLVVKLNLGDEIQPKWGRFVTSLKFTNQNHSNSKTIAKLISRAQVLSHLNSISFLITS